MARQTRSTNPSQTADASRPQRRKPLAAAAAENLNTNTSTSTSALTARRRHSIRAEAEIADQENTYHEICRVLDGSVALSPARKEYLREIGGKLLKTIKNKYRESKRLRAELYEMMEEIRKNSEVEVANVRQDIAKASRRIEELRAKSSKHAALEARGNLPGGPQRDWASRLMCWRSTWLLRGGINVMQSSSLRRQKELPTNMRGFLQKGELNGRIDGKQRMLRGVAARNHILLVEHSVETKLPVLCAIGDPRCFLRPPRPPRPTPRIPL